MQERTKQRKQTRGTAVKHFGQKDAKNCCHRDIYLDDDDNDGDDDDDEDDDYDGYKDDDDHQDKDKENDDFHDRDENMDLRQELHDQRKQK